MKILVTNDDGYFSEGLKLLVEKALKYGEVLVCAPKKEQSAKSQSINVRTPFRIKQIRDIAPGVRSYYVDSTPADCVRCAYYHLHYDYDIVFSGINNGFNMGEDISYSGTVGAASEAVFINKKALAFSTITANLEEIDKRFDDIMEFILNNKLFDFCSFYNINVPLKSGDIRITKQGQTNFDTYFDTIKKHVRQLGKPHHELDLDRNDDVNAIHSHCISITPLTINRTDLEALKKLKQKFK